MSKEDSRSGKVFIVGAGPGAPDLITLKGLRALRRADVVFYDALVNPELLSEADPGAEVVFVGKRCGRHVTEQSEINRRMVLEASSGKTVVRLKGGDPVVFGRGGEEALACEEAGIDFELVPGISSALGAASYAGIPLTHRGTSTSVAFATAHEAGLKPGTGGSLARLAQAADTLVIFMGGSQLRLIVDALRSGGVPKTASVAVISQATLENQRTVVSTLESIVVKVESAQLTTPMLIMVGEVVNLAPILNWYERRPCRILQEELPTL